MLSVLWPIVILINLKSFVNAVDDFEEYNQSYGSLLVNCAMFRGVCIKSGACPWERIIPDKAEVCSQRHNNLVCCKVAHVRTPVDMFLAYE